MPALESNVIQVLADYTAGDPSDSEVVWTFLTPAEISEELAMAGTPVGTDTVRKILDDFGFVQRKAQKYLAMGASPDRDAQFNRIATHKADYDLRSASRVVDFRRISPAARRPCDPALTMIFAMSSVMASVQFARRAAG